MAAKRSVGGARAAALARMRATSQAAKGDMVEMAAMGLTAFGLGVMNRTGTLERVPSILGLPKTVTVFGIAKAIAWNTSGKMRQGSNGAANAAGSIALFRLGNGESVMGAGVEGRAPERGRLGRTIEDEQRIARRLASKVSEHLEAQSIAEQIAAAE